MGNIKKSLDVLRDLAGKMRKGGSGSGNYDGPGTPRVTHVRQTGGKLIKPGESAKGPVNAAAKAQVVGTEPEKLDTNKSPFGDGRPAGQYNDKDLQAVHDHFSAYSPKDLKPAGLQRLQEVKNELDKRKLAGMDFHARDKEIQGRKDLVTPEGFINPKYRDHFDSQDYLDNSAREKSGDFSGHPTKTILDRHNYMSSLNPAQLDNKDHEMHYAMLRELQSRSLDAKGQPRIKSVYDVPKKYDPKIFNKK